MLYRNHHLLSNKSRVGLQKQFAPEISVFMAHNHWMSCVDGRIYLYKSFRGGAHFFARVLFSLSLHVYFLWFISLSPIRISSKLPVILEQIALRAPSQNKAIGAILRRRVGKIVRAFVITLNWRNNGMVAGREIMCSWPADFYEIETIIVRTHDRLVKLPRNSLAISLSLNIFDGPPTPLLVVTCTQYRLWEEAGGSVKSTVIQCRGLFLCGSQPPFSPPTTRHRFNRQVLCCCCLRKPFTISFNDPRDADLVGSFVRWWQQARLTRNGSTRAAL